MVSFPIYIYRIYFAGSVNTEIARSKCFWVDEVGKHHLLNSIVIFAGEHICVFKNETLFPEEVRQMKI